MNDIGKQITALIESGGKAASAMTHALKKIGNGDMQKGIMRIANFSKKEGIVIGAVGGALTATALIFAFQKALKEHKKHKAEGEAILIGLEEGLAEYEAEGVVDEPHEGVN